MAPSKSPENLRDGQILERLLAAVAPARAQSATIELLRRHGSLGALFGAIKSTTENDVITNLLVSVREALVHALRTEVSNRPVISTGPDLLNYLFFEMSRLGVEEVRVLFLDTNNRLICDEVVVRGSVNEAPIYPREIMKRALECGATAIIMAHNHPSGDPTPSASDIASSKRLILAGRELGIVLHDHVIVARTGWTSLRMEGLL